MSDGAAMLGVERSLLGKRWRARLADSMAGLSLAQSIELPELIGRVLAARGIAAEEAPEYLDPTLRRLLPDPLHLRDMEKAIARLARALRNERENRGLRRLRCGRRDLGRAPRAASS